jgi:hypothetical protein
MNTGIREWEIGLHSWIIQDGNYGNFKTGQVAEFALEFYSTAFRRSNAKQKTVRSLGDAKYEIIGEVIYLTPKAWVLDFGLCAFQDSEPPEGMTLGGYGAAEIYLGIDPYFYFKCLHALPNMPPLIYSWKINTISQETAPFIETTEPSGRKLMVRDAKKLGYKVISQTDAWNDDHGHAENILTCARLEIPPKFETVTST